LQTAEVVIGVQGLKLYEKAVTFKSWMSLYLKT
jgi:hypothetical protein